MSRSNPMHHSNPQTKFSAAFARLKEMGVPVYKHPEDSGNFSIDAEAENATEWVDSFLLALIAVCAMDVFVWRP